MYCAVCHQWIDVWREWDVEIRDGKHSHGKCLRQQEVSSPPPEGEYCAGETLGSASTP